MRGEEGGEQTARGSLFVFGRARVRMFVLWACVCARMRTRLHLSVSEKSRVCASDSHVYVRRLEVDNFWL